MFPLWAESNLSPAITDLWKSAFLSSYIIGSLIFLAIFLQERPPLCMLFYPFLKKVLDDPIYDLDVVRLDT